MLQNITEESIHKESVNLALEIRRKGEKQSKDLKMCSVDLTTELCIILRFEKHEHLRRGRWPHRRHRSALSDRSSDDGSSYPSC